MHGYYGHTLKLVRPDGDWVYAQFHLISDQGVQNFTAEEASKLWVMRPKTETEVTARPTGDRKTCLERSRGKSESIANRGRFVLSLPTFSYPSWTMKVQIMTSREAEQAWSEKQINVLDLTHVWPHADYPLREVGRIVLNENAKVSEEYQWDLLSFTNSDQNYFAEVEQAAFNPSHMVPGIEPSADPVLQARLFSYPDAHRHRIGANYQQLPVNQPQCPFRMANFQRDGQMAFFNQGSRPAYLSSIEPVQLREVPRDQDEEHGGFVGKAVTYLSEIKPEDFTAPRE